MIVTLENGWGLTADNKEIEMIKNFFEPLGAYSEKDAYMSDSDKEKGRVKPKDVKVKWIGHIDEVPVQILNHSEIRMEFYKGVKAMVDEKLKNSGKDFKEQMAGTINVHLPSNEMLGVNKVTWLEDACTEALQKKLDAGFRILSCIPRPGQRRPDYVLGMEEK